MIVLAAAMLFAQLRLQEARLLAPANDMSGDVQASACQGHLLAAWREGSRIAAAIDGRKVTLSEAARGVPAVACGRASWLVIWPSDDFGVDGLRVGFDGTLFSAAALFRGPFGASEVAAAYGDDRFLIAWADGVTIRALRVNDSGTVLGTPIAVNLEGLFVAPRIVWTGTNFFLAFAEDKANPLSPKPTRFWGTHVSPQGTIEPMSLPLIEGGAGMRGLQPSIAANGERITFAWVAEHGAQTCVDVAEPGTAPRSVRCSGDDASPVLDEAEVRYSRGELLLVWRELKRDFSSVLYALRLGDETPTLLAQRAWGVGLTATAEGVGVAYFAASPPPDAASVGAFLRVVEQKVPAGRRRAVR